MLLLASCQILNKTDYGVRNTSVRNSSLLNLPYQEVASDCRFCRLERAHDDISSCFANSLASILSLRPNLSISLIRPNLSGSFSITLCRLSSHALNFCFASLSSVICAMHQARCGRGIRRVTKSIVTPKAHMSEEKDRMFQPMRNSGAR